MLAEYGHIYSHRYISKVRCELQEEDDDDFTCNCQIYSVALCKETIQWGKNEFFKTFVLNVLTSRIFSL